jgi:tRNA pseudouridine32 synthase/23S rRNA pseudouridine746 synthase
MSLSNEALFISVLVRESVYSSHFIEDVLGVTAIMFDIIHLTQDFIVINKHPNVSVHKDDGDTMLLQQIALVTGDSQLYLIHRLDKMTSGILLLARHHVAASELSKAFADRLVEKFYLALASKKPKKKQGTICGDMQRSRRSSWMLLPSTENPAITQFFSAAADPGERVFICKPHTGKTHQIRVALKSVGSPIVGDPIYNVASQADRGYLHALVLRFPFRGVWYTYRCDPREYAQFGLRWLSAPVSEQIDLWLEPEQLNWPKI